MPHIEKITITSSGHTLQERQTEVDELNKSGSERVYERPVGRYGSFATFGDLLCWFAEMHLKDMNAKDNVVAFNRKAQDRFKEPSRVFLTYANTNYTLNIEYAD